MIVCLFVCLFVCFAVKNLGVWVTHLIHNMEYVSGKLKLDQPCIPVSLSLLSFPPILLPSLPLFFSSLPHYRSTHRLMMTTSS